MKMFTSRSLFLIGAAACLRSAVASSEKEDALMILFDDYVEQFAKIYSSPQERQARQLIFQENLQTIREHKTMNAGAGYTLGINEWTDRRLPDELPLGLKKKRSVDESLLFSKQVSRRNTFLYLIPELVVLCAIQNRKKLLAFFLYLNVNLAIVIARFHQSSAATEFYQEWLEHKVVPVADLPAEVDWRTHQPPVVTPVKQQGMCGSCWAVASAAVLESHIAIRTGQLYALSPQELVSCVENPEHCGGAGGCTGATYELAFDYVTEHGMVLESEFPYKSGNGKDIKCSLLNATQAVENSNFDNLLRGSQHDTVVGVQGGFIDGAVATINGYMNFPTNNYTLLMNAVATLGPIGVTVAANAWGLYTGGVFSLKSHNSTDATDVNHAVVLEGYGIDQESQEPYWLVRNSWGAAWGEGGYIRLARVDPSTLPDFDKDDCGMDTKTSDGAGCTKDKDGNDIVPKPVKVCGTSAILYDTFVPIGGRLLSASVAPMVKEAK